MKESKKDLKDYSDLSFAEAFKAANKAWKDSGYKGSGNYIYKGGVYGAKIVGLKDDGTFENKTDKSDYSKNARHSHSEDYETIAKSKDGSLSYGINEKRGGLKVGNSHQTISKFPGYEKFKKLYKVGTKEFEDYYKGKHQEYEQAKKSGDTAKVEKLKMYEKQYGANTGKDYYNFLKNKFISDKQKGADASTVEVKGDRSKTRGRIKSHKDIYGSTVIDDTIGTFSNSVNPVVETDENGKKRVVPGLFKDTTTGVYYQVNPDSKEGEIASYSYLGPEEEYNGVLSLRPHAFSDDLKQDFYNRKMDNDWLNDLYTTLDRKKWNRNNAKAVELATYDGMDAAGRAGLEIVGNGAAFMGAPLMYAGLKAGHALATPTLNYINGKGFTYGFDEGMNEWDKYNAINAGSTLKSAGAPEEVYSNPWVLIGLDAAATGLAGAAKGGISNLAKYSVVTPGKLALSGLRRMLVNGVADSSKNTQHWTVGQIKNTGKNVGFKGGVPLKVQQRSNGQFTNYTLTFEPTPGFATDYGKTVVRGRKLNTSRVVGPVKSKMPIYLRQELGNMYAGENSLGPAQRIGLKDSKGLAMIEAKIPNEQPKFVYIAQKNSGAPVTRAGRLIFPADPPEIMQPVTQDAVVRIPAKGLTKDGVSKGYAKAMKMDRGHNWEYAVAPELSASYQYFGKPVLFRDIRNGVRPWVLPPDIAPVEYQQPLPSTELGGEPLYIQGSAGYNPYIWNTSLNGSIDSGEKNLGTVPEYVALPKIKYRSLK